MKLLKIIFISILVLIVLAAVGLYIFAKTFDIKKYKAQIVQQASEALGREVGLKDIALSMSLQKGLLLEVDGLTVKDLPQYSAENFFQVGRVKFAFDFLSFLRERKVTISGIFIQSPNVVVIRAEDGTMNVETIGKREEPGTAAGPAEPKKPARAQNTAFQLPVLLINALVIENASFTYIDRFASPPVKVTVPKMDLKITNFSLFRPADLYFAAAVLSAEQNLKMNGKLQIDPKNHQGRLDDVKIDLDLGQVQMQRVAQISSALESVNLVDELRGQFQAEVSQLVFGMNGIITLTAAGNLKNGFVRAEDYLKQPVENIQAAFELTENDCTINNFSLWLGSGSVTGSGRISDYFKKQTYSFKADAQKLKLEEVLAGQDLPLKILGNVEGTMAVTGAGFDPNVALNNLKGSGNLKVTDGKLADFNLLRSVLNKIALIPNLVTRVEENLPEKYKDVLNEKDTYLRNVDFETKIQNGGADITKAVVETDGFFLSGSGRYGFDQNVRMDGALTMPQDLSKAMGASVGELKYLFDDAGQIYLPVTPYEGPLDKIRILPDLEYLGKRIIVNKGTSELEDLINKALGVEKEEGQPQDGQPASEQPNPGREIIRGVLDSILGPSSEENNP